MQLYKIIYFAAMTKTETTKNSKKNKVDDDCIDNSHNDREIDPNLVPLSVITVETDEDVIGSFDDCINNLHHTSSRRRNTNKRNSNSKQISQVIILLRNK